MICKSKKRPERTQTLTVQMVVMFLEKPLQHDIEFKQAATTLPAQSIQICRVQLPTLVQA